MKIHLTVLFLSFVNLMVFGQESKISLNDIKFKQFKNENCIDYNFQQQTSGKIVIIEFWETWCGPCIDGMHHLKNLKKSFPNSLEIICVSNGDKDKTIKFIAKNNFDFTFIYDSLEQINTIFPHSGIPHSVLIDSKGQVKAQTSPGYITEQTINKLLQNNSIHLPKKYNPNKKEEVNSVNSNSLINFSIQRHQLGEPTKTSSSTRRIPLLLITGYSGTQYVDTFEMITNYELTGKNILELYRYTFNGYPISRFVVSKELDYITSNKPNHLYNINFSVSSFLALAKMY